MQSNSNTNKAISCNALVAALQAKGLDVKEDLNGSYQVVAKGDDFDTTDNLLFVTTMYPESTEDGDYISDSAFVRGRVNGNRIGATGLTSVEDIVSQCTDAFGIKSESKFKCSMQKKKESLLKTNEENLKWNEAEFKGMNRCNFEELFETPNRTGTTDGKIEVVAQCDKVTIEKVADGVVSVDIEPYTTPGKKFLVGRTFRSYYPQFGGTDEDAPRKHHRLHRGCLPGP